MANQGYVITIASGATSGLVDLAAYAGGIIYLNNRATAGISLHGSTDGLDYYPIQRNTTATAGVGYTTHVIGSALSGKWIPVPSMFRYIKVITTETATDGGTVKVATTI